jgi:hypothetical protein
MDFVVSCVVINIRNVGPRCNQVAIISSINSIKPLPPSGEIPITLACVFGLRPLSAPLLRRQSDPSMTFAVRFAMLALPPKADMAMQLGISAMCHKRTHSGDFRPPGKTISKSAFVPASRHDGFLCCTNRIDLSSRLLLKCAQSPAFDMRNSVGGSSFNRRGSPWASPLARILFCRRALLI